MTSRSLSSYIITSYDEHQIYQTDDTEGNLQFISGFSGVGDVVVIIYTSHFLAVNQSKVYILDNFERRRFVDRG